MATTFVVADTHFGHRGVVNFMHPDGTKKLRPWATVEEMDEALVENWNKVVTPKDKVYLLGDVTMNRKALPTMKRLNGDLVLVKGNHDTAPIRDYLEIFRDVRAVMQFDKFALTHVPVHPDSLYRWRGNIHGHLHADRVMLPDGKTIDPRYLCVSVEHTNFAPISWDEAKKRFDAQQ